MGRDNATTKLDPTPALSAHSSLIIAQSIPLDRSPAAVYLAQLKQSSRRPQKQALDLVASLLTSGTADCLTLNWAALRYQHTAAVRGRLLDTYAPATANRILSALRGVFLFSVQKHEKRKGRTSGKRQAKRLLSVKRESLYTEGHEQRTQAAYAFS